MAGSATKVNHPFPKNPRRPFRDTPCERRNPEAARLPASAEEASAVGGSWWFETPPKQGSLTKNAQKKAPPPPPKKKQTRVKK